MKNIKKFVAALLCLSIVMLCGCTTKKNYGQKFPVAVCDEVSVEECYLYSGEYVEDASFENCENVVALKVKNTSLRDIQLIRIKVTTNSKEMMFEVSTLLAGETVIVLEKSKQTMSEKEKIVSFEYENRIFFEENVTLKEEIFVIQGNPKTINIKNISETEIESDVYVYYKKKDADGNCLGGITFRTKAEGIGAGEIRQLPAANFDPNDSEVLFVDYAG